MSKKLGVVIFINEAADESLAALQWASDYSPLSKKDQLVILFVKEDKNGSNERGKELETEELSGAVPDELEDKFHEYMPKFGTKKVKGIPYQGPDILEMLEGAIKTFQPDTLVLGMEAVRSTTGLVDLLLNSQCSVVLAKKDCRSTTGLVDLLLNSQCSVVLAKKDPKATFERSQQAIAPKTNDGSATSEQKKEQKKGPTRK